MSNTCKIVATIGLDDDTVFTDEAIASLVGQSPQILRDFNWADKIGDSVIAAAERSEGGIKVTLEVSEGTMRALGYVADDAPARSVESAGYSLGYRVPQSGRVEVLEVCRVGADTKPAFPLRGSL